jgi:hypothetical protein
MNHSLLIGSRFFDSIYNFLMRGFMFFESLLHTISKVGIGQNGLENGHDVCTNCHMNSLVGSYIILEDLCGETMKYM